jgi:hypothetical protein
LHQREQQVHAADCRFSSAALPPSWQELFGRRPAMMFADPRYPLAMKGSLRARCCVFKPHHSERQFMRAGDPIPIHAWRPPGARIDAPTRFSSAAPGSRFGRQLRVLATAVFVIAAATSLRPCTTFCLSRDGAVVFGRNFDYYLPDGRVMVNRRGLLKTAFSTNSGLQWISRYGSLTFHQFGHEFPNGGMNEAGLVVEHMYLDEARYPSDQRLAITELQWVQYMLDTCTSVADVLAADARVRISTSSSPLHFLIADRTGASAAIEFLNGRTVVHTGATLPVAALTNHNYAVSLAHEAVTPPGQSDHTSSLGRFVHAAAAVRSFAVSGADDPVDLAFATLANVSQPNFTRWSIAYDLAARVVHFRTSVATGIKRIRLDRLDFRIGAAARMMDINSTVPGEVTPEGVYSYADNLAIITTVFRGTPPLAGNPSWYLQQRAAYPDSVRSIAPTRIEAHPVSQTVAPGGRATFTVLASGEGALDYEWSRNGSPLPDQHGAVLTLSNLQSADAADYAVTVSGPADAVTSRFARLVVAEPEAGCLCNMSVRAIAGADGQPLIVGFFVRGGPKDMLVRAVGPTLTDHGVTEALPDVRLDLHQRIADEDHVFASNDDWGGAEESCAPLRAVFDRVGAFQLPSRSCDAALFTPVEGACTAHVSGAPGQANGIALVETYDAGTGIAPRLVNVSARNRVGTGNDVLIAGFVINGNRPKRLLVRGVGPGLLAHGVPDPLVDPVLEIHTTVAGTATVVAANDNWSDEPGAADAAASAGAFALDDGSQDAALVVTLPAGTYTAVVSGAGGTTGHALVEVYDLE